CFFSKKTIYLTFLIIWLYNDLYACLYTTIQSHNKRIFMNGLLDSLQLGDLLGSVGHLVGTVAHTVDTVATVGDVVVDDVANLALSVDHILDVTTSVATTAITADIVNVLLVADAAVDNTTIIADNLVNGTVLPAVNTVVGAVDFAVNDMVLGTVGSTLGLVDGLLDATLGLTGGLVSSATSGLIA
ncbi:MAG: hypothetical protein PHS85_09400, partial [Sulfurovum sp.]|nr:hypothetical protein [Sulfurovum sp.]